MSKNIIVTGAGSGIGRAIAQRFDDEGSKLLLIGRRESALEETLASLKNKGHHIAPIDVRDKEKLNSEFNLFAENNGGVHGLIANAGVNPQRCKSIDVDEEHIKDTIDINFLGAHNACQAALPILLKETGATIVTIGSIAGMQGMRERAAYGPSKAAVINYTQALAADYSKKGLRANCICPGFVITDINREWINNLESEKKNKLEERHLLGFGTPEQIASVAWFLSNKDSSWMTGAIIPVDGGWTAW